MPNTGMQERSCRGLEPCSRGRKFEKSERRFKTRENGNL